jgi:hypothetical protein
MQRGHRRWTPFAMGKQRTVFDPCRWAHGMGALGPKEIREPLEGHVPGHHGPLMG